MGEQFAEPGDGPHGRPLGQGLGGGVRLGRACQSLLVAALAALGVTAGNAEDEAAQARSDDPSARISLLASPAVLAGEA
jgi:hypothetical protein